MASGGSKYCEAGRVSVEIASHAKFGVGTAAPSLQGLQALVDRHGTCAENQLPGILCACGIGDPELYDAVMAGARMVLAAFGGVAPGQPPPPGSAKKQVCERADEVLSCLNRVGEHILARAEEKKDGAH